MNLKLFYQYFINVLLIVLVNHNDYGFVIWQRILKKLKYTKNTDILYILCQCLYQNGYEGVIYFKNRSQYHLI